MEKTTIDVRLREEPPDCMKAQFDVSQAIYGLSYTVAFSKALSACLPKGESILDVVLATLDRIRERVRENKGACYHQVATCYGIDFHVIDNRTHISFRMEDEEGDGE